MQPSRLLFHLVVILIAVVVTVSGQDKLCFNVGNFTANDTLQTSLDSLLGTISTTNSSTMAYGLFNASTSPSQSSEVIETMGYCRGDLDGDACRTCFNTSAYWIRQLCPLQKKAIIFDEKCTLKYSNDSMYGVLDLSRGRYRLNSQNASNWDTFSTALKKLLDDLRDEASSGGPLRKYAAGTGSVDLLTLYATVQCSPDLDNQQCRDCLNRIAGMITPGKVGARTLWPSCQLRYEIYRFFDPTVSLSSPAPAPAKAAVPTSSSSSPPGKKKSKNTWIIVAASSVSAVLLVVFLAFLIAKIRKGHAMIRIRKEDADDITIVESLQFDLEVITEATENFSDDKTLGQGGFGSVYLGKLPNGQEIAVKRLSKNSGQGELEFKNEVVLLARLQHRNLVRLLGFCLEGDERLLVYEFVPNSSLDQFIFDPIKRACLDWDTRFKTIMGIARGLLYLHEDSRLRIIHRDLKASNILLDADMSPKVSDFGTARLFELEQTQADTNRIVGTYGYMAPEYVLHGHFSVKSDVFSFGVLVLEIVSGRKNLERSSRPGGDPEFLLSHVWKSWRERKISDIVDPSVTSDYSPNIIKCIHIGLLCVQENMSSRPTMASVVVMLNSHSVSLPMPTQPAFLMSTGYVSETSSSIDGTSMASQVDHFRNRVSEGQGTHSINGVTITELRAR